MWNFLLETYTRPLPPTLHKYLYLWSDHRAKGAWWLPPNWYEVEYEFRIILII